MVYLLSTNKGGVDGGQVDPLVCEDQGNSTFPLLILLRPDHNDTRAVVI
jgi:hypothetical protein